MSMELAKAIAPWVAIVISLTSILLPRRAASTAAAAKDARNLTRRVRDLEEGVRGLRREAGHARKTCYDDRTRIWKCIEEFESSLREVFRELRDVLSRI